MKAKKFVTVILAAIILIAAAWSIANIAAVANYYHKSGAAWLIGVAFGSANAISVFVFAISHKGAKARLPAIVGTVIFGVGSAAIQYHLYHEIDGVGANVAIWFATLGPAAEALLAWLEAAMTADEEAGQSAQQVAEWEITRMQMEADQAAIVADNEHLRRQIAEIESRPLAALAAGNESLRHPQPAAHPAEDEDQALIDEVQRVVDLYEVKKAADLQEYMGIDSLRSAQRILKLAKDAGAVSKNGAGYVAI